MRSDGPSHLAPTRRHPIIHILVSFPIAFFTGALVTDIAYADTANMLWADFSDWLLAAGIVLGGVAAVAGLLDLLIHRHGRAWRRIGPLAIGCTLALLAALADNFVHSRDAWTSVVPTGLALSAVTVVLTLATAWFGFATPLTTPHAAITAPIGNRRTEVRA